MNNWLKDLRNIFYIIICLVASLFFYNSGAFANSVIKADDVKIDSSSIGDFETTKLIMTNHAKQRAEERGTNEEEIKQTIFYGEQFPAKQGRLKFEKTFAYKNIWNGRYYNSKKLEVIAVKEDEGWVAITVITKFF